jgi:lipopolysaccharide biosynthesis protein
LGERRGLRKDLHRHPERLVTATLKAPTANGLEARLAEAKLRVLAFHLPQFHAIPENDHWWGKGFTEWTNVRRARPFFPGHDQPRVPSPEIGYYDMLAPGVLDRQAEMARRYGVEGFSVYHFWFDGKQLLGEPMRRVLAGACQRMRFCLAWANEPWTRQWDGRDHEVLQPQWYGGPRSWLRHYQALRPALEDPRAVRVDGRPLLLVYRIGHIPDPRAMLECWREAAERDGVPVPFVVGMLNAFRDAATEEGLLACDGVAEFAPFAAYHARSHPGGMKISYEETWERLLALPQVHQTHFRGAFVSWDNTPRRAKRGVVFDGATPERYRAFLLRQVRRVLEMPENRRLLFINAWNEWGEGCSLEPDVTNGWGYLEATAAALDQALSEHASAIRKRGS